LTHQLNKHAEIIDNCPVMVKFVHFTFGLKLTEETQESYRLRSFVDAILVSM